MFHETDDLRVSRLRPLIPPAILLEELPLTELASKTVLAGRKSASEIIKGRDDRLLVVVGPCSIHDPQAALEYGDRLVELSRRLDEDLLLIMRVYFEKPRTTVGWKGLINDPDLDHSFSINNGLRIARKLLIDLNERGIPAGHEVLDTITPQFIADLIAWGAIGARTTESQVHRQLTSGLSMPVGFKNGTHGNIQIAVDAVRAAASSHHFLGVTKQGISAIVSTTGNDCCHIILRGGKPGPNFRADAVGRATFKLEKVGLPGRVAVDCSHGNSGKDHSKQPTVAADLAAQIRSGSTAIMGIMLESNLVAGRQDFSTKDELTYGLSITDACLGWDETVPVLEDLADAVRTRRNK